MNFDLSPDEKAFEREVNDFLKKAVTKEVQEECRCHGLHGPHTRRLLRQLGDKGWLGISWPKKYGGQEGTVTKEYIICNSLLYHRGPLELYAVQMVGPCILRYGSEHLKASFLPRIARGEIEFTMGYTEPDAGSDLASLRTQATRDGDHYIINGQKVFSTGAQQSEYYWLAARTDPKAPKHKGISVFIVDLKNTPGITIRPIWTLSGERTNEVFLDNVRVSSEYLLGNENEGWTYITDALAYERTLLFGPGRLQRLFDELVQFVKDNTLGGKPIAEDPLVQHKLANMAVKLEVCRLFAYRCAWMLDTTPERPCHSEGALLKIFQTEFQQEFATLAMQILQPYGGIKRGWVSVPLEGWVEYLCRDAVLFTFGAGGNEILRDYIARRWLQLGR